MKLLLKDNLPFITVVVAYKGVEIEVPDILLDTTLILQRPFQPLEVSCRFG